MLASRPAGTAPRIPERRVVWLLVVVLIAQLVMLAMQVPAQDGERPLLAAVALRLVAPLARAADGTVELADVTRRGWRRHSALLQENVELQRQVEAMQLQLSRLRQVEEQYRLLAAAEEMAPPEQSRLWVAEVVYLDQASRLSTLILHVGGGGTGSDTVPLELNQPVLTADGLIGRVVLVAGRYARVQLVTDSAAGVGAKIERTRRQGVARGLGDGRLELQYISRQADAQVGDLVVTAGNDGVYPRGLPVGQITEVTAGDELFHRILMSPAVDFARLDHVYVLERQTLPEELREPLDSALR